MEKWVLTMIMGIVIMASDVLAADPWMNTTYNYRKKIVIDSTFVNGTLTDFPLMISFQSDNDLVGGTKTDSNGTSILFGNSSGTKLNHELEIFNNDSGRLTAWVRMPVLSNDSNTTIYMYYGNPNAGSQTNRTAVWDRNYKVVLHMSDNLSTTAVNDSLENNTIALTQNTNLRSTLGKVGNALSMVTNDYINMNAGTGISAANKANITIELWANFTSTGADQTLYSDLTTGGSYWRNSIIMYNADCTRPKIEYVTRDLSSGDTGSREPLCSNAALSTSIWYHIVGVYDSTNTKKSIYVNGVEDASTTTSISAFTTTASSNIWVGLDPGPASPFAGMLDELRVSDVARSQQWITTEYNNQKISNFIGIGTEESQTPPTDTCTCPAQGVGWWGIKYSDNCKITTECNMNGHPVYVYGGPGTLEIYSRIYNFNDFFAFNGGQVLCWTNPCLVR
jgi:hypothetical protein